MNIHEPCFPLDPVDRICTKISNTLKLPITEQLTEITKIKRDVLAQADDLEPILKIMSNWGPDISSVDELFYRCHCAVIKNNSSDGMNWSDTLGLVYSGDMDDFGDEYENQILPQVKALNTPRAVLDRIKYGHLPEVRKYQN